MLRAIGLKRGQVAKLVIAQALGMAAIGLLPGVLGGIGLAWGMCAVADALVGVRIPFHLDVGLIAGCVAVAFGAGAAYALEPQDWIFPSYRELAFAVHRGIEPAHILHLFRGTWHGGLYDYREHRVAPYAVPIATQTLHAVGFATGAKLDGSNIVTITCFGDGATSEGDFHEAANFAANLDIPVIFFCQNNGWAISVPSRIQCSAPTVAQRGIAFGMDSVQVDGNDIFAVVKVVKEAKSAEGVTLTLEATDSGKAKATGTVDIVREDGAWKVGRERWSSK